MIALQALNPFDWFLIAVLLYSTIAAFMRGFFRETFSLVGLIRSEEHTSELQSRP